MPNLISDFKRAWRISKLIRAKEISENEAIALEKVDTIYMEECRALKASVDKATKALNRSLAEARKSLNRKMDSSGKSIDKRLAEMEDSLVSSVTQISQLTEAYQKALTSRLGQVEQSSQTTMELVDNVREYVAKQADETRRWQEGYDWRILKNYLMRVISTLDDVEDKLEFYQKEAKSEDLIKDFDFLRETLEIHLEEEGLIAYSPNLGEVPDANLVDIKSSRQIEGDDQTVGAVAEVIRKGYEIDLGTETKVVRKAQITVYQQ